MKLKRILCSVLAVILLLSCCSAAMADMSCAYWHEKKAASDSDYYQHWMADIPDDTPINDISVPGTHDSMAYTSPALLKNIVVTQTMTLRQQLDSGIRYLDIRLADKGSYLGVYHSIISLNVSFDTVLDTVSDFLEEHPSETVFMRIRKEHEIDTMSRMRELFGKYYNSEKYSGLFYETIFSPGSGTPTLGDVRGKIYTFSDAMGLPCGMSYGWLEIQDEFKIFSHWQLYSKWKSVRKFLNAAEESDDGWIYLNHLSGNGVASPHFVAGGKLLSGTDAKQTSTGIIDSKLYSPFPDFPRVPVLGGLFNVIRFQGTNKLTADYINRNQLQHVGIIAADFPGEALISAVIACNFR